MNTLEFIYQDTEIHFALQNEGNVMVNATEMAKMFNRRTKDYLKTQSTKQYVKALERALNGAHSESKQTPKGGQIIQDKGHVGIYFERRLALKFAAWLDVDFELWVFSTIDNILFGNYKKHWDAHQEQVKAEKIMEYLKPKLLVAPTPEMVLEYFEAVDAIKNAKSTKQKAIRKQYKIDFKN